MATYPRNGWTLMQASPYYDEAAKRVVFPEPVDPQPEVFDDREPPDGHNGLPVRSPDGKMVREFSPSGIAAMVPLAEG